MAYSQRDLPNLPTLDLALQGESADSLKKLAAIVSSEKHKPTRKAELVEFIQRQVAGDRLQTLWRQLDKLQQAAVAETVHSPDTLYHGDRFVAKYGGLPNWGTRDRSSYRQTPSLLALFFFDGVMPDDLKQRLKSFVPPPAATRLQTQDELPAAIRMPLPRYQRDGAPAAEDTPLVTGLTEQAASHDLKAVLRLIDAGKLTISETTFQPGAAALKAVEEVLLGGDFYDDSGYDKYDKIGPIKPFAWPLLLQAGGLAKVSGKRLELTSSGRKALTAPPAPSLGHLWQRWLKNKLLDELRRIDCIKGQTGKGKHGLTAVAGRRPMIDAALKQCPPGQWVAVDELFRYMRATDLNFEITRNPWSLYISNANYGSLGYDGFHDWMILQGRYALCLLLEYAATLGLIDVAYIEPHNARRDFRELWGTDDLAFLSRYDGLQYLRVNPLGAYCLGLAAQYVPAEPEVQAELQVLPNLEIAATGEALTPGDILLLDHYAARISDAVWKLEQSKVLAAVEAGHSIAALQDLLASRSGRPLPDTVSRFLADMASRVNRLQDKGAVRLIECADTALAALIANDARTRPFCLLTGERYLVVPLESEARFRTALRKLGYSLPK